MRDRFFAHQQLLKLTGYIFFIVVVFVLSLFALPFEMFFLTSVVILMTLRGVEKELMVRSKYVKQK
jgi:hypothetical protein